MKYEMAASVCALLAVGLDIDLKGVVDEDWTTIAESVLAVVFFLGAIGLLFYGLVT